MQRDQLRDSAADNFENNLNTVNKLSNELPSPVGRKTYRRQTFAQLRTRERGVSRRLSAKVKDTHGDFGTLTQEESVLTTIYDKKIRTRMQRWYFAWTAINVFLCVYIVILMGYYWEYLNALDCIR